MRTIHVVRMTFCAAGHKQRQIPMKLGDRDIGVWLRDVDSHARLVIATDTTENLPRPRSTSEADIDVRRRPNRGYTAITITYSSLDGGALRGLPKLATEPDYMDRRLGPAILEALSIALPEYRFV